MESSTVMTQNVIPNHFSVGEADEQPHRTCSLNEHVRSRDRVASVRQAAARISYFLHQHSNISALDPAFFELNISGRLTVRHTHCSSFTQHESSETVPCLKRLLVF